MQPSDVPPLQRSWIDLTGAYHLNAGLGFDVVRLEFAKQRAFVDSQAPGCGFSVAFVSSQCLDDKKNLHLLKGLHLSERYLIRTRTRTNGRR